MRMHSYLKTLALALPLAVLATGCILIPEIEDRIVELAVGHSIVVPFVSSGETNTHNKTSTINVALDVSLDQILADNGIDATAVKDVKLAGVSYRVTTAEAGRSITGGTVEFVRHATSTPPGSPVYIPLVTSFGASAASTTGWITVPLASAGVTGVNALLTELLNEAKGLGPATNTWVTYHVSGVSLPLLTPTNFKWEFKLDLTIVGTFKTKIVN